MRASSRAPSTVLWSVSPIRSRRTSWLRATSSSSELWPSCEKFEWRWRSTRSIQSGPLLLAAPRQRPLERRCCRFSQHPLASPGEKRNDLPRAAAVASLLHQCRLGVVDDLHHLLGAPLAAEACWQLRVRLPKHDHEPRNEPAWHDADLLDQTFLNPEKELIRLLQHSTWRHRAAPPAIPTQVAI